MSEDRPRIFTAEYYRRIRAHESAYWWHRGVRELAGHVLRRRLPASPRVVFDVGCGTGETLRWLEELFPAARCVGVDVALEAVRLCRSEGLVRTAVGSALALPFPEDCADLVVCHDVLQHLPLPDGDRLALGEIRRVLRPGAHLLLRTNASRRETAVDGAASFRVYHPSDLERLLEECGFGVEALSRINLVGSLVQELRRSRAASREPGLYTGLPLAAEVPVSRLDPLKRGLLSLEGRWIAGGRSLPFGCSAVCLARSA